MAPKGKRVPPKSKSEMQNDDGSYKFVLDLVTEIVKPYGGFENLELADYEDMGNLQFDIRNRMSIEIPTGDMVKLKSGAAIFKYLLRAWDRRVYKARDDERNAQRLAALTLESDFKEEEDASSSTQILSHVY